MHNLEKRTDRLNPLLLLLVDGILTTFLSITFQILIFLLPIHLKIEIHMLMSSTDPFFSDIKELRNKFLKYPIQPTTGKIPVVSHHTNSMQAHKCIVNDRTHVV